MEKYHKVIKLDWDGVCKQVFFIRHDPLPTSSDPKLTVCNLSSRR